MENNKPKSKEETNYLKEYYLQLYNAFKKKNNVDKLIHLLEKDVEHYEKININFFDEKKDKPIHHVCYWKYEKCLKLLLLHNDVDLKIKDFSEKYPHQKTDDIKIQNILRKYKKNPNGFKMKYNIMKKWSKKTHKYLSKEKKRLLIFLIWLNSYENRHLKFSEIPLEILLYEIFPCLPMIIKVHNSPIDLSIYNRYKELGYKPHLHK